MKKNNLFLLACVLGTFFASVSEAAYFPVKFRYPTEFECAPEAEGTKFRAKGSFVMRSYAIFAYPQISYVAAFDVEDSDVPYIIESGKYFKTAAKAKQFCVNLRFHMGRGFVWKTDDGSWRTQHTYSTFKNVERNGETVRLLRSVRKDTVVLHVNNYSGVFTSYSIHNGAMFHANKLKRP